jgi:hypothetical protein
MVVKNNLETYYGRDKSILVYQNDIAVLPEEMNQLLSPPLALSDLVTICNLCDTFDSGGNLTGWAHLPENKIAIDPVLGRLAFPKLLPAPETVHVSFYYGFSAALGGGEYSRETTFTNDPEDKIIVTSADGTIQDALDQLRFTGGVVEIQDNEYYFESPVIRVAEGKTIELRSADGCRPVLVLADEMLIEAEENSTIILNGLLISGSRLRLPLKNTDDNLNRLQLLRVLHCTFLPSSSPAIAMVAAQAAEPRIVIESPDTAIEFEKSITGALRIFDGATVKIRNSIVDALDENELAFAGLTGVDAGGTLHVENSTIIGKVNTLMLKLASNSIFLSGTVLLPEWPSPVIAQRVQQGCARFSYFPPGSRLPHPYKCQPFSLAIAARVRPVFTSLVYGDAGYCQLSRHCATEISRGADDDSEMGVFHSLYQPQRESNLRTRLDEYLRFGLEAGIFYAS